MLYQPGPLYSTDRRTGLASFSAFIGALKLLIRFISRKLLEIYTTQRQWRDFKSNEEVIKFLNLSQDENKKNINDLKIITKEKSKINLEEVPTMILNGKRLPINISEEEFINKVESLLRK